MWFFSAAVDPYLATAEQAVDMALWYSLQFLYQEVIDALARLVLIDGYMVGFFGSGFAGFGFVIVIGRHLSGQY
jgi:hypothetical protein